MTIFGSFYEQTLRMFFCSICLDVIYNDNLFALLNSSIILESKWISDCRKNRRRKP